MGLQGGVATGLFATLALTALTAGQSAPSATPSLTWRDVRQVVVHCNIQDVRTGHDPELTRQICDKVRTLAAGGAPMPLRVAGFGDPALVAGDGLVLAVQGTATGSGDTRALMFTIRPHRASADAPPELFGTTLRAAPLSAADPAISEALSELLPWKARSLDARPIR